MVENIILGTIAAVVGALLKVWADRYSKSKAERDLGMASDYLKITEMTGAQLEKKINQINVLEAEIERIKEARKKREIEVQGEREALEARIKAELIDSREIRFERVEAQQQIAKLENTVIKMAKYIDTMNTALKAANIPVPQNGELMDSVRRLQLSIEERAKLKVGK